MLEINYLLDVQPARNGATPTLPAGGAAIFAGWPELRATNRHL
jgi:hypothetical protein